MSKEDATKRTFRMFGREFQMDPAYFGDVSRGGAMPKSNVQYHAPLLCFVRCGEQRGSLY